MIQEEFNTQRKQQSSVIATTSNDEAEVFENVLRPHDFKNYIGQMEVKENLRIFCQAAKERGDSLDHTLFYGPPGIGKTTLSLILSNEMGTNLRVTSGPALEKPGDLAAILSNLKENDFLFIDEIHRLRSTVEEILYTAMEDFAIDIVVGKGPSARTMRLNVPRFTLVGATTKASMLAGPLRDRFGHVERLRFYEAEEIQRIIERSAGILKIEIDSEASAILSASSRRTPRIANRLLRRMRDFAQILHQGKITSKVVKEGLEHLSIDEKGLDHSDQMFLKILCEKFNGGPVGLSTMAAAMSEEENTIEDMIEPFLIREGFLKKTPRGRMATGAGFAHAGVKNKLQSSNMNF